MVDAEESTDAADLPSEVETDEADAPADAELLDTATVIERAVDRRTWNAVFWKAFF